LSIGRAIQDETRADGQQYERNYEEAHCDIPLSLVIVQCILADSDLQSKIAACDFTINCR